MFSCFLLTNFGRPSHINTCIVFWQAHTINPRNYELPEQNIHQITAFVAQSIFPALQVFLICKKRASENGLTKGNVSHCRLHCFYPDKGEMETFSQYQWKHRYSFVPVHYWFCLCTCNVWILLFNYEVCEHSTKQLTCMVWCSQG